LISFEINRFCHLFHIFKVSSKLLEWHVGTCLYSVLEYLSLQIKKDYRIRFT